MTTDNFAALGLSKPLLRAITDAGLTTPTPIQTQAIPLLLEDWDLLGIAQTGTGKTAAFSLPLLDNLYDDNKRCGAKQARALILAPTRELVIQIADNVTQFSKHLTMHHAVVMGGVNIQPQIRALQKGVDILIATPGRLLDLVQQGHADLSRTEYLVLDEADRMLDMGFIRDVRRLVSRLPDERQSMLFSATMPADIAKLAAEILYQPKRVEIAAKSVAVDRIVQTVHHLNAADKTARLAQLLRADGVERTIVFTRTKHGANKVVKHLDRVGIAAEAIHGNKSQSARQKTLDNFRSGRSNVLIATDIASRGIDVDQITHVINYELPHEPETYVHRIGRTARAGAEGIAISLCGPDERSQLRAIEKLLKRTIEVVGDMPATPAGKAASAPQPQRAKRNEPGAKPGPRPGRKWRSRPLKSRGRQAA